MAEPVLTVEETVERLDVRRWHLHPDDPLHVELANAVRIIKAMAKLLGHPIEGVG